MKRGVEPDSLATGAPKERFQLDVYRALAAMAVATFHAYQSNRGRHWPLEGTVWHELLMATDMFVAMFFVLSGLLLGLPVAKAALGDAPPRSGRVFLIKRVARLVPAYFLVVLVVWAVTNPELPGHWQDLVLHLTFTHVYSDEYIFWTDGPAWSLGDEMHFYLLLAVLGALAYRVCRRLSSRGAKLAVLFGGTGTLIAISVTYKLLAIYVWHMPKDSWATWFGPLAKLDLFAIGLVMAIVAATGVRLTTRWMRIASALTGAGVIVVAHATKPGGDQPDPFVHTIVAVGCALVIASTTLITVPAPRFLSWKPLVAIGLASYSLYLWHEPVLRVLLASGLLPGRGTPLAFGVTAVALLTVAIPLALLSYRVIEKTGMKIAAAFDHKGHARDYYPSSANRQPA
ncbi:acyltransferase family protein [Amycolatopsis anabasis]|uniref:acyltransferase family protein n=1 Tax=Amycolatopsis anabasis TaxID=1840409 RepID=UPI001FE672C9|nr:acyltransferase [Amycolatopsis anabasis]